MTYLTHYNPPDKDDYPYLDPFVDAYDLGFMASLKGLKEEANPYEQSGHERDDSSMGDQQHYQWYRGYWDGYEHVKEKM